MSEDEKETKGLSKILEIVKDILSFNKQNQQGRGLKILTPNQMLSRLPIALAQLKPVNNSEKPKNEIRQILYSLYRSKNMTKQMYNNLINYIWIKWKLKILILIIAHKIFVQLFYFHSHYDYDYDYCYYSHYNNGDNFYEYWK